MTFQILDTSFNGGTATYDDGQNSFIMIGQGTSVEFRSGDLQFLQPTVHIGDAPFTLDRWSWSDTLDVSATEVGGDLDYTFKFIEWQRPASGEYRLT